MFLSRVLSICFASIFLLFVTADFEYEAVFKIEHSSETHSLNLAKGDETSLKFIFVKTDEGDLHGIEEKHSAAETADNANSAITVNANANAVTLDTDDTPKQYNAVLDTTSWLSVFNVNFPSDGYYALFAEHDISEFAVTEGNVAFLKDGDGHDIEALYYVGQPHTDDKSSKDGWRDTLLGCLVVWAVTLSGVILFVINKERYESCKEYVMMFASGTLLSTAFALVLFEAVELINNPSNEGLAAGRWTSMIMVGFITSPVIKLFLTIIAPEYMTLHHENPGELELTDGKEVAVVEDVVYVEDGNPSEEVVQEEVPKQCSLNDFAVFIPLILGDFFHNFSDGIFIGSAFKCNASFAWKIVGITVAHEAPQEIGDFVILTQKLKFSTLEALLYNVLSGASVMLGGITIMAANTSDLAVGMLLAYGAGNYLYVATIHLFEDIDSGDIPKQLYKLLAFCIGVVAIGLVLLDHEHCENTTSSGGHAGHGH